MHRETWNWKLYKEKTKIPLISRACGILEDYFELLYNMVIELYNGILDLCALHQGSWHKMVSMVWSCFLSIIFNYDTKGIGFIFRRLVCFYRVVSSEFYIACLTFSITFRYEILCMKIKEVLYINWWTWRTARPFCSQSLLTSLTLFYFRLLLFISGL